MTFLFWDRDGVFSKKGSTLFFLIVLILLGIGAYFGYRYFFPDDQKTFNQSILEEDVGGCSSIDDPFLRRSCIHFILGNPNITEEHFLFTDPLARTFESIHSATVYPNGTQIPCERIDDAGLSEACLSLKGQDTTCSDSCKAWVSYLSAIKKDDPSLCDSLTEVLVSSKGVSLRGACFSFFEGYDTPPLESLEHNEKYYRDALFSLKLEECEKITLDSFREKCREDVSLRLSVLEDQQ
ncbi:hypothetical protein J4430_02755 [Candidatus Woesearchaeota archaeon]|nr:hypothetical protein [Candidatus Woesearchaeota archaeon]